MAILKIALMGNPILKKAAAPVEDPTAPEIARLAADMRDTLEDVNGNGLSAPQVHISKRVVIYRIPEHQIPPGSRMKPIPWRVLVNPVLTPQTDERKLIWERCLSLPGLHGEVPRYTKVRLTARQLDGSALDVTASGFHAMLLQHECDHLDGILYPMRMDDLSRLAFNTELGGNLFFMPRSPEEFTD